MPKVVECTCAHQVLRQAGDLNTDPYLCAPELLRFAISRPVKMYTQSMIIPCYYITRNAVVRIGSGFHKIVQALIKSKIL